LKVVPVKFKDDDAELLKKVSAARAESVSAFVRMSVKRELAALGFLDPEEGKALGIARA
jgi:hypothetical protein